METQALVLGPTRELAQQIEKARSPPSLGVARARKP
jgi:superfamily II DNA/RNA helicase